MTGWNDEGGLRWRALTPFGVEIDRDLSTPLGGQTAERFVALFQEAGLIVARGQTLAMEEQVALMALLGPVSRRVDGVGYISSEDNYTGALAELTFHADYAFSTHPLDALSLHAVDVVDGTSSTRFASAGRAYTDLPVDIRERLAAHAVEMISPNYGVGMTMRTCDVREPDAMLREKRPSVLVNPRTGRSCLGVGEMHTARLIGMDWEESRALLGAVYEHLYAPDNIMEHVWHRGDIVIWDNITFQHARGSIEAVGRRVLQRVTNGTKGLWDMYPGMFPGTDAFYALNQ
ncbi:MAG: TauD/TfdA family dioxygenase [Rhodospirillaceae bacterium]|nr:MAG: TauD/TfdA family dioxygenase [Rhodospirillaceae bacterium]